MSEYKGGLLGWANCNASVDIPEEGVPVVLLMHEMPSIESMQGMPLGAPMLGKDVHVRIGTAKRDVDMVGEDKVLLVMDASRMLPNKHLMVRNEDGSVSHFLANP